MKYGLLGRNDSSLVKEKEASNLLQEGPTEAGKYLKKQLIPPNVKRVHLILIGKK